MGEVESLRAELALARDEIKGLRERRREAWQDAMNWEDRARRAEARADKAEAEVERLRKANESLRRQRAKLVSGLLPLSAECPAPGGCGNCALCHRDTARAIVRMTDKRVRDAGFRPMPEGLWDALAKASRAEAAEAKVARVEALAEELGSDCTPTSLGRARRSACELIRAALEGGDDA